MLPLSEDIGMHARGREGNTIPNKLLKDFYLFIFRERGREGKRKGEKHQCVVASRMLPTGDLAHNPGICLDWESNL